MFKRDYLDENRGFVVGVLIKIKYYFYNKQKPELIESSIYSIDEIEIKNPNHNEYWDVKARCLFTGLTDCNGVEIYEGDIINYLDSYDCSTESGFGYSEYINKGVIIWSDKEAMFNITNKEMIDRYTFFQEISEFEVIGNIYENKELLDNE